MTFHHTTGLREDRHIQITLKQIIGNRNKTFEAEVED